MIFLFLQSYLEIISIYVEIYELLKESGFLLFWCAKYNFHTIWDFGWVSDVLWLTRSLSTEKLSVFAWYSETTIILSYWKLLGIFLISREMNLSK